jgi:ubiquinone/menaquinone biosynthesis C-methylase UbiE
VTQTAERAIAHNRDAHDRVGAAYDARHPEIFNDVEQERLRTALTRAVSMVAGDRPVRALDVGSGTGNLTSHLLALGAEVTASDLSSGLLAQVTARHGASGRLRTHQLNGRDLQPLPDGAFDLVATYSVLHHIPDYAALVAEMARVVRPGGIVVIDHERTDESWRSPAYAQFLREAVVWPPRRWWYVLQPSRYWKRLQPLLEWQRWGNPRWMPEGDLHIWPDDHIEWARVERALAQYDVHAEVRDDYLLFEPRYQRAVWEAWRTRCADMRCLIARRAA